MTVKELREKIQDAPDDAEVVWQGNEEGEEDVPGEATHTFAYGTSSSPSSLPCQTTSASSGAS